LSENVQNVARSQLWKTVFTFEAGKEVMGSAVSSCAESGIIEHA